MKLVRQKHVAQNARCRETGVLILASFMALTMGRVAAQSEPAAPADRPDGRTEQLDEITVFGQRSLRELRLEVQAARERVYDLFNSLNSNDEFDIYCHNAPRTGTRIPQRVCRPQYADNATSDAGREFALALSYYCEGRIESEACLERSTPWAQAAISVVPGKDQQLVAEVQRLTRENSEFRRAIAEYQVVEGRYEGARRADGSEGPALRASVSIIDTAGSAVPSRRAARQDAIVAPQAIELVPPEAPRRGPAEGALREGWVKVRYSVLADGATADVRAVDAMPPGLDPLSAMVAVQAWTFEPASADGVPIDWHNNLAVIVFNRAQAVHEGWPEFAEAYEAVAELIASARYADAKARNERMLREVAVTLEDIGVAEMQRAAIEHALGDPQAALDAIRRATEPDVSQLADEELTLALEHRFALELQLGLAVDALETYERRAALARVRSREAIARQAAALRQNLEAPDARLAVQGRIDGNGHRAHALTLSTFALVDVDGRIEGLEVECNRNKAAMPFEADVEVTIPAAWGACALLVTGRPDTTFTLYEFRDPGG